MVYTKYISVRDTEIQGYFTAPPSTNLTNQRKYHIIIPRHTLNIKVKTVRKQVFYPHCSTVAGLGPGGPKR